MDGRRSKVVALGLARRLEQFRACRVGSNYSFKGNSHRADVCPLNSGVRRRFLRSPFGAPFNLKADSAPQVLRAAGQIVAVSRALTGQSPAN